MHSFRRRGKAALATTLAVGLFGVLAPLPAGAADLGTPDLKASSDTGLSATDNITNAGALTFTVTGAATNDVVQLLRDGAKVAEGTAVADALELTDAAAPAGSPSYTLKRGDEVSPPLVVTVDRTAPTATPAAAPDLKADSDSGKSATDNITNDKTPTIDVTAVPLPEGVDGIELQRNGASIPAGGVSGTYGSTITEPTLADGNYLYRARYVDTAGNGGPAGPELGVRIDSVATPLAMSLSTDTGRSTSDRHTNLLVGTAYVGVVLLFGGETVAAGPPHFPATGADLVWKRTDPTGAEKTLVSDGISSVPAFAAPSVTVLTDVVSPFISQPPINGVWKYDVSQTDPAGNTSTAATLTITVDTKAPITPTIDLLPISDKGSSASDNVTRWDAKPTNPLLETPIENYDLRFNVGAEADANVDLYRDGNLVTPGPAGTGPKSPGTLEPISPTTNPATNPQGEQLIIDAGTFNFSATHGYVVVATDQAGNSSNTNLPVWVDVNNPPAPLQLDLLAADDHGPADDDNITKVPLPRFQVSGAEEGAIVELTACEGPGCTLTLSLAPLIQLSTRSVVIGTTIGNGIIQPQDNWWTKTRIGQVSNYTAGNGPAVLGNAANSSWRFSVRQRDVAGRQGTAFSPDLNVVIDTTPLAKPSAPDLLASSDTGESDSDNRTGLVNPTFNVATASGRVELLRDGNPVATRTAAGEITDPGPLGNGAYTYTVRATDTAGNQSTSDPLTVVVENGNGYWLVGSDGGVFAFGGAGFFGSTGDLKLNAPILGIEATPKRNGYWLLSRDGGVFAFGDAGFHGSTGDQVLNAPILGMVPTASGKGYWLFAPDGGVFAFGDAAFLGSPAEGGAVSSPIVAMRAAPDGNGYWLIARNGKVYAFGSATALRGLDGTALNAPIVGAAATPSGKGLWLVGADGGIFTLGDAVFHGSTGDLKLNSPIIALAPLPSGAGYWLLAGDGGVFTFGAATFLGSTGDQPLNKPIVGMAVL
jgi:hypothetical protein